MLTARPQRQGQPWPFFFMIKGNINFHNKVNEKGRAMTKLLFPCLTVH